MLTDGESACARQLKIHADGLVRDKARDSAEKDVLSAEATAIFHADLTETHAAAITAKIRIIQEIPHEDILIQENSAEIQETEIIGTTETTEMTEAEEILEDAKAVATEETAISAMDADALKIAKDAVFLTEEVLAEEAAKRETMNIDFVA